MNKYVLHTSGRALFLILIAIGLFSALSYAVTYSTRGSGDTSRERNILAASRIVQYGTEVQQAIMRMMVINDCSNTEISFERSPFDGSDTEYVNTNAPASFACHIFHQNGGGVTQTVPSTEFLDESRAASFDYGDYYFSGSNWVIDVGTDCATAGCMELVMILPYLKEDICRSVNSLLDVTPAHTAPPTAHIHFWVGESFMGTYGNAGTNRDIGGSGSELNGQQSACVDQSLGNPGFHYYHTLIVQ